MMKWRSRTSSTTRTRRHITSRVPAETVSSSPGRTWRTARRWRRVRAVHSSLKSSTIRSSSRLEKPSRHRHTPNWRSLTLEPVTSDPAHTLD